MTRILSRAPRWDILEKFYRVFDNGRKRGCVEQWQEEMPKRRFEQDLFETKIHTEFLNDRRDQLNEEFRWTFANMKKLITIDQRIRELNNEINRTFNATKKTSPVSSRKNTSGIRNTNSKPKFALRTIGASPANTNTSAICSSGMQIGIPSTSLRIQTKTNTNATKHTTFQPGSR